MPENQVKKKTTRKKSGGTVKKTNGAKSSESKNTSTRSNSRSKAEDGKKQTKTTAGSPKTNETKNSSVRKIAASSLTVPDRYLIKEDDDIRTLSCFESPNITVQIERGSTTSAGSARKATSGSIFLDGAAQGEPFLDHEKQVYNLDHHEGCIRAFTLSTCEQTMVMLLKGLDLRKREWRIIANEPDLDTVFGIWVLLNNLRLKEENSRARKVVTPLLRLEGAIDAHGLEFTEFCGFSDDLRTKTLKTLDNLMADETRLKRDGLWDQVDFLEYTTSLLRKIDQIVYRPNEFSGFQEVEEISQLPVYQNKIAVACRADAGIYETEQQLKKIYGNRLALVILQRDTAAYTIRQSDLFLPGNLESIYERLNIYDPKVRSFRVENRWGGSTDIGGSPRASGTGLTPREIIETCRDVFLKVDWKEYLRKTWLGSLLGLSILPVGWLVNLFWSQSSFVSQSLPKMAQNPAFAFTFTVGFITLLALYFMTFPRKRFRLYGLEVPVGLDWLSLVLPAMFFGFFGGAWTPWLAPRLMETSSLVVHIIFMPLVAELLYRGLVHGLFMPVSRTMSRGNDWFLSRPILMSAALYTISFTMPYKPYFGLTQVLPVPDLYFAYKLIAGFAFGILLGVIRERSESLFTTYIVHVLTVISVILGYMHFL